MSAIEDLQFLSTRRVAELTSLPVSTIYYMADEGRFPAPCTIAGSKRLGWRARDIHEWLEAQQPRPPKTAAA